jgi:hypothetical protein
MSTQQMPNSAKVDWDETTYRITRIPKEFDLTHLLQLLNNLFEWEGNEIRIHSLAYDATDEKEPLSKVATVSFRTRPTHLQSTSKNKDEWSFDIALGSYAAENEYEAVANLLLEWDDVNADSRDSEYGRTPLSSAGLEGALCSHQTAVRTWCRHQFTR